MPRLLCRCFNCPPASLLIKNKKQNKMQGWKKDASDEDSSPLFFNISMQNVQHREPTLVRYESRICCRLVEKKGPVSLPKRGSHHFLFFFYWVNHS